MKSLMIRGVLPLLSFLAVDAGAQAPVVRMPERDRPLAGAPAPVFSVGQAEGSDEQMFGAISAVAFDARDNLYVLDPRSARVMVYGPTGRFLRQIGKKGRGPGELSFPVQFAVAPDGTVMVHDGGRPFIVFNPDGTYRRDVSTEGLGMSTGPQLAWHSRGGVVGTFRVFSAREGNYDRTETTVPLMFQPVAGGAPVRLFQIPEFSRMQQTERSEGTGSTRTVSRMVMMSGPPVFAPTAQYGALPGGEVALSFTSGYTVRILNAAGQTARYLQRPVRTRLTTEADREAARDRHRERMRTWDGPSGPPKAADIESQIAEWKFADTIAVIRGLRTTPRGRIWVERTGAVAGMPGPLDLITAQGEYLGTTTAMKLPNAVSAGGLAAFIEKDEDDVDHVVVRRLPAGWR